MPMLMIEDKKGSRSVTHNQGLDERSIVAFSIIGEDLQSSAEEHFPPKEKKEPIDA